MSEVVKITFHFSQSGLSSYIQTHEESIMVCVWVMLPNTFYTFAKHLKVQIEIPFQTSTQVMEEYNTQLFIYSSYFLLIKFVAISAYGLVTKNLYNICFFNYIC